MEGNVFRTIEEKLSSFSKGKQQIATYILQNPNDAPFQTAAQIGKAVKISESTVVRFAADLGYKGFPDFQRALQGEVKSLLQKGYPASSDPNKDHSVNTYDNDFNGRGNNVFERIQPQNPTAAKNAVEELSRCRSLFLLTTPLGQLLHPYCRYAGDMVMDAVFTLPLDSADRLFAVMSSMASGDVVLALAIGEVSTLFSFVLEEAGKRGGRIVLITDVHRDASTCHADIILKVSPTASASIPDLTGVITLIRGLFTSVEEKKSRDMEVRNKIIKELQDTYDKFQI